MDGTGSSELNAHGFSMRTGYYLAQASNFAYEDSADWAGTMGLEDVRFFTCGQFHGFVGAVSRRLTAAGSAESAAVLAFRGTQSVGNCLTDIETRLITHQAYPGRVHQGFAQAVENVWPDVLRLLGHPSESKPLWVTGHSLGGAMATLASVRLAAEGYPVRAVYTYGSPRVGDRLFHKYYTGPNYRFVHDNDLVPHLPFRWCYKHVGELKLLDRDGNLTEDRPDWVDKKRQLGSAAKQVQKHHRRPAESHCEFPEFDWLADHLLEGYLAAIRKLLARLPRRRIDRPAAGASELPSRPHLLDGPAAEMPLLPVEHDEPEEREGLTISEDRFTVSEEQLIEAFFNQPDVRRRDAG